MLNKLIDTSDSHHLLQKITFGTRPNLRGGSNTLDLLFTNNHQLINHISPHLSPLSDHTIITCSTTYDLTLNNDPVPTSPSPQLSLANLNMNKANFANISCALSDIDWPSLLENKTGHELFQTIDSHIFDVVEPNCPKFTSKPGQSKSKITRHRRILFRQRKRKLKLLQSTSANSLKHQRLNQDICEIETKLINSYKDQRLAEETRAVNNIKTNPKHFYSFARKHQLVKGGIGPLKVNDTLITSPQEISEALSTQYSSVFSSSSTTITDPISFFSLNQPTLPTLTDINFTRDMIEEEIDNLKINSAPGPDHFPVLLLKSCKKELSLPIYLQWRNSLDRYDIAPIFLHAIVCPVLKPNSESYLPKSYRPISLTSHIIKIFEKIIRKAIINHLEISGRLPSNQHGFLQGRSTLSHLLAHVETITRVLESAKDFDCIYLDFAKAFDKVDHSILCSKLKNLGIGGKIGVWLHSFLTNRTQQVSANGAISSPVPVLSGVPQGTVLGPILFIIMISDMDKDLIEAFIALFADDTRACSVISSEEDTHNFQLELDNTIYPWAQSNKAVFNGDKFEHIHFGHHLEKIPVYLDPLQQPITTKTQLKDLGVLISNDLSWIPQINKVISNCRKQTAWILRTFSKRDIQTMRTLWTSLVRPIIDYCSPLWSPKPTDYGAIDKLEGVLRSFSKQVDDLQGLNYRDRLNAMNLQSIQRRHERYKIIYIYKIKEGFVPNLPRDPSNPTSSFALTFTTNSRCGCRCSIPNQTLHHNPAAIPRESSFALTACNLWNCLPPYVSLISKVSVTSFKNQLDKFLALFPDDPRCSASGMFTDPNTGRVSNSIWHMRHNYLVQHKIRKHKKDARAQMSWTSSSQSHNSR